MAEPSDLVTHYSSKALQTRLAALTFVGAVLSANVVWQNQLIRSDTLGIGLLLVVGSLAELNRRYTYSYLCACLASARSDSATQKWRDFASMNEAPWSLSAIPKSASPKPKSFGNWISRFLLSWETYIPGIAAGGYLAWSKFVPDGSLRLFAKPAVAMVLVAGLLTWRGVQTSRPYNPEVILGDRQQ